MRASAAFHSGTLQRAVRAALICLANHIAGTMNLKTFVTALLAAAI